jgi:hypothetical protein
MDLMRRNGLFGSNSMVPWCVVTCIAGAIALERTPWPGSLRGAFDLVFSAAVLAFVVIGLAAMAVRVLTRLGREVGFLGFALYRLAGGSGQPSSVNEGRQPE